MPTRRLTANMAILPTNRGRRSTPSPPGHARLPIAQPSVDSLGFVVMMAKLGTHSPAGGRQFSHEPPAELSLCAPLHRMAGSGSLPENCAR